MGGSSNGGSAVEITNLGNPIVSSEMPSWKQSAAQPNDYWRNKVKKFDNTEKYKDLSGIYDDEYAKHIASLRERYPMLTELLLNGPANRSANLSTPEDTNKYARLADAYNARYRYKPTFQLPAGPIGQAGVSMGGDPLEAINKIETQDQKQMDTRRANESALRAYFGAEESHYQRELLQRKMNAMEKYFGQMTKEQFYQKDEEMRQLSAMFDMLQKLSGTEYEAKLKELGIPSEQLRKMQLMIEAGDFQGAMFLADRMGFTPQTIEQWTHQAAGNVIAKAFAEGNYQDFRSAFMRLGDLKGAELLQQISGLLRETRDQRVEPILKELGIAATGLAHGAVNLAQIVGDIGSGATKEGVITAGLFAAIASILGPGLASLLKFK